MGPEQINCREMSSLNPLTLTKDSLLCSKWGLIWGRSSDSNHPSKDKVHMHLIILGGESICVCHRVCAGIKLGCNDPEQCSASDSKKNYKLLVVLFIYFFWWSQLQESQNLNHSTRLDQKKTIYPYRCTFQFWSIVWFYVNICLLV